MTPLGYLPLADAIQRCAEAWKVDRKSAWYRLRPYLHCGQVYSCTIGASGSTYEADRQWGAERNERADEAGFLLYARLYDDGFSKQKAFVEEASLGALLSGSLADQTPSPPPTPVKQEAPRKARGPLAQLQCTEALRKLYTQDPVATGISRKIILAAVERELSVSPGEISGSTLDRARKALWPS